jgi:hypothetical protein
MLCCPLLVTGILISGHHWMPGPDLVRISSGSTQIDMLKYHPSLISDEGFVYFFWIEPEIVIWRDNLSIWSIDMMTPAVERDVARTHALLSEDRSDQ